MDLTDLNLGDEPENTRKQVHSDNYVLNQIRNLLYADPENLENHPHARQPDGELIEDKATGQVFEQNSTLDVDETFTSGWFDTDGFSSIEVFVSADAVSKVDGVKFQFTEDVQATTPTVDAEETRSYDNSDVDRGFRVYKTETTLDGFRFVYENNSTAASINIIGTAKTVLSLDGANYVKQNQLGNNEIRVGSDINGFGIKIGDPASLFGDVVTIERTTIIDQTSSFGTSTVRDEITSSGSGAITADPDTATGEIVLSTGTTADSRIELRTAEYGRYTPGFSAQTGVGIRIPTAPTEGEAKWGYFDDDNGFYWGYDGDQGELFVARRSNGSESDRVYRSDWNRNDPDDVFDQVFSVDDGAIFQIDYSWYGYGIIQFSMVSQTDNDLKTVTPSQDTVVVHAISVTGETSISDPNQPISVEAKNATNGEDYDVRVGGRQYSVFGQEPSGERITAHTNLSETIQNGAWTHVMSWRRSGTGIANARLNIDGLDFAVDQTSQLALVINANLSSTNYGVPELVADGETLLEVSNAGTFDGIGDGTKVWEASVSVPGTGQAEADVDPAIELNLGQDNVVSLIAKADGDTGDALSTMRLTEDW